MGSGITNLNQLLRLRAGEEPGRRLYTFLHEGETEAGSLTAAELDRRARGIAAALRESCEPGDRALLLFPAGLDFIAAFFGCLYAGVMAVPAYPPRSRRKQPRIASIAGSARPAAVLTTAGVLEMAEPLASSIPELASARWVVADELPGIDPGPEHQDLDPDPETPAFLQYTSGSTAAPKGVIVTHRNLLHNEEMIRQAFRQDRESVVVGWLPQYHDMGLIGNVLQPLYCGGRCVLMSPVAFLQRPQRWLEAISRYRATTSGGPNFAYELCVQKVAPAERERLDLTSWRVAFNGAEPVRAETLSRFASAFAGSGFRPEAFYPCYGLAEATLFVSGPQQGELPTERRFESAALEAHEVRPVASENPGARRLVGCGTSWGGQRLVLVDPESGTECPPGRVGEIWIAGPSVAAGYWEQPEETARTFYATLGDGPEGPFLRTGDLGFLDGGELFITGRLKDLIVLRGRNHYPQDIELTVEQSHPALRPGCGASFSVDVGGEERLVVLQEVDRHATDPEAILDTVRQAVVWEHEVQAHEVVLLRIGGVLKTSSGKVQRRACRVAYLAGELPVVARSLLAETSAPSGDEETGEPSFGVETLADLPPEQRTAALQDLLQAKAARVLSMPRSSLDPQQPLTAQGLDSLTAAAFQQEIASSTGLRIALSDLLQGFTLEALAADLAAGWGRTASRDEGFPVVRATSGEHHPLSYGQRALWFLQRLAPESAAYNIAAAVRTASPLDVGALRRALEALLVRHAVLRTAFGESEGEPWQRVRPEADLDFQVESLPGATEEELRPRLRAEAFRPFDLTGEPLLRVRIYETAPDRHLLLLSVHHIVADFTSIAVLLQELDWLYREAARGLPAALPALSFEYLDYVLWQEQYLASEEGERSWSYWRERLAGELPLLALSTDRPRPPVLSDRGGSLALRLRPEVMSRLRELGSSQGTTLFTVLLAAFQTLLHRHSGQLDILVGSPAAGRTRRELAGLVGYFVQPVVLRAGFSGDPTVAGLLLSTRDAVAEALEHQDFPLPLLTERLQPERAASRSPLFQAFFVLHQGTGPLSGMAELALGGERGRLEIGGLELESLPLGESRAQFDLTLSAAVNGDDSLLVLQYSRDLFDESSIARRLAHLEILLEGLGEDADRPVRDLPLLTAVEQRELLAWNVPAEPAPDGCLHELFVEQAARSPEAEALVTEAERLTYAELDRRSNRLARRLRALGVGLESRVGVHLERSADLVTALLAVLKAGGAYVPLDPAYPGERLAVLLEDSGAEVLITREALLPRLPRRPDRIVLLDAERQALSLENGAGLAPAALPGSLAYLIYTSGSTGRPKGVAIAHRNAVALVRWARPVFSGAELSGVLAATSIGFDLSVFELFVPLSYGGRVIVADNALALPALAAASEVTLVNTVPSAIAELLERGGLPAGGVTVNLAGEALSSALVRRLHGEPRVRRLLNLYGPSETTTYSTFAALPPGQEISPPIGHPIAGTRVYLLDPWLRPVPYGVPGEIYIGGEGVSRGYYERQDLTAERFVPDPFSPVPGERLYRTGDLARRRPQGDLEYLGREDHQVKIRGFRIELGEVESALESHPRVRQAVVVTREAGPGDRRLLAYLVFAGEPVPAPELRSFLGRTLPDSMIPAAFVGMEAFPLTPHGKVDRRALPPPVWETKSPVGAVPRNEVEELLAALWADVLGLEEVGVDDDFFDLGGHSLLASRVLARVERDLGARLPLSTLFQAPTIAALAGRIAELGGTEPLPPLRAVPRAAPLPLSFAQQRLWFLHQMEPESAAYNVPGALRLSGPLRAGALEAALREVVRRHESLRTGFPGEGGEPQQVIAPEVEVVLTRIDLASLPEPARARELAAVLGMEAGRPFDLLRPPLLRACLLRLSGDEHTLLLTMHHIVSDGLSLQVLFRELASLYAAALDGRPSPLPAPPQYADFAIWQRNALTGARLERLLAYWRERLADTPPLELPTDRPRPAVPSPRGGSRRLVIPADRIVRLRAVSRSLGVTPFMTYLGALSMLFVRYSGQEDFALGTPVATRATVETEGMVGLLVNSLVLRANLSGDPAAGGALRSLREVVLGAHAHQDLPFERLVEELQPERALNRTPLFQVMVAFFSASREMTGFPGLRVEMLDVDNGTAKFDLTALLREEGDTLLLTLAYRHDLFEAATIDRLGTHYEALLQGIAADPGARISRLPLLTEAEIHQLASEWNSPTTDAPRNQTVHGLFEAQARQTPDRLAVVFGSDRLTYAELDRRSRALSRVLRGLGVGPEVLVGLCVERSVEAIVGILGVLKAGGAYVPMDPEYPRERLAFLLEDSGARVVLTQQNLLSRVQPEAARVVLLDQLPEAGDSTEDALSPASGPENLAYVIYTSGSTGQPKGTLIEHRSVVNLAHVLRLAIYGHRSEPLRVSVNASLAFDASVKQIVQLLHGHTLQILPEEVRRDGERLLAYLREQPLDVLDCTPSQLGLLLANGSLESEELSPAMALVGGEAISEALWQRLAENRRTVFYNVYGPTECTVDATAYAIRNAERPTLGRPLANVQIRLLDRRLNPVPAGVPGEICIAGAGLARGYLNRPALTAERFIPHPASPEPGARIYRTGDLGRYLPEGRIEYLGRADHQVKVRGLRIELGEIEGRLELHPRIDRAVAVLREDTPGDQRLVAYFTGSEGLTDAELRLFLRQALPDVMIPAAFVHLPALPLSAHGKIDRRKLPAPSATLERELVAPRTPLEESLAQLWGEVLRLPRVGIRDNFFELGGHSLLAVQLASRIRQAVGIETPVRALFEHPTIEALAPVLERSAASQAGRAPEPVLGALRRGRRDTRQLLEEIRGLSPEEARNRLSERRRPDGRS